MKTTYIKPIILGILLLILACNKEETSINPDESESSFFPMHIGNYWKSDIHNYTEIIDTLSINGDVFYKFYTVTGGDAISINYYRIDQDQNLIVSYPENPDFKYTHAKFNANLRDTFYTLKDKSYNDYRVEIITKNDSIMIFEFQKIHHPILFESKHQVSYLKGKGWKGNWKEICINGKITN